MADATPDQASGVAASAAALAALGHFGGKPGKRLAAAVAVAQVSWPAVKWARARYNRHDDFTIVVAGTDSIYTDLHAWVLERIPEDDRKALIAVTGDGTRHPEIHHDSDGSEQLAPKRVSLRCDGEKVQTVTLDGHRVKVHIEREPIPGGREFLSENWRQLLEKVTFTASSPGGRDAVVKMIEALVDAKESKVGPPPLYMPPRWGGEWRRRKDLPPRTLESVVLRKGQLERIVADLEQFLAAEGEYNRLCQPWHRGYLLYGPPGTGKTSVARAIANHLDMPVYYLPLGDLDKEVDLTQLVGGIEPRSMLLMEDVDVFHALTRRDDEKPGANISTMLNALDGVWTPHGLVTVMTTNDRSKLDEAILRKGRIDVHEKFGNLTIEQGARLAQRFGLTGEDGRRFRGQSPADAIQTLREEVSA